jgi:hypothetical protein
MDNTDQANPNSGGNNDQNNSSNNTPPAWIAQLDGDLQKNERFTQFKTISEMGKTLLDLEGNSIRIPGENATAEERKAFYAKLGVPEAADKYELDDPKLEKHYTAEADKMLRQVLLNAEVSKKGAKVIHQAFVDMLKGGITAQQKAETDRLTAEQTVIDGAVNTLKDTWKGETFKANTELAHRAFKNVIQWAGITEEEGKKFFEETKIGSLALGNHPMLLKMFHAIAGKITDDSMGGERGGGMFGEKSEEDKAKTRFPNTKFNT